jgi:hypothetical protein
MSTGPPTVHIFRSPHYEICVTLFNSISYTVYLFLCNPHFYLALEAGRMKLFYTFQEIKSCDRKKDEVDFYLKANVFWAL